MTRHQFLRATYLGLNIMLNPKAFLKILNKLSVNPNLKFQCLVGYPTWFVMRIKKWSQYECGAAMVRALKLRTLRRINHEILLQFLCKINIARTTSTNSRSSHQTQIKVWTKILRSAARLIEILSAARSDADSGSIRVLWSASRSAVIPSAIGSVQSQHQVFEYFKINCAYFYVLLRLIAYLLEVQPQ